MDFQRVSGLTAPDGHASPGFLLTPAAPRGGAVVCHGYGSSKEQMLGVLGFLRVDAKPAVVSNSELRCALRFVLSELAEVIVEAGR